MDKIKKRRGVIRATVTKLVQDITSALEMTPIPAGQIEEKLNFLASKEASLYRLDAEIADLLDVEEIETDMEVNTVYEESINNIKTKANRVLRQRHQQGNETTYASSNLDSQQGGSNERQNSGLNVKLPRLELPKYNGAIEDWQTFWDQFQSSIHHNPTLSQVDKFKYLKTLLVDKADAVIKGISVTDNNYTVALELLEKRFGQPTVIINNHLSHFMDIKSIESSEDTDGLRKLHDDVTTRTRSLQSLGVNVNSYGVLLHTVLQRALPPDLLLRYNRHIYSQGPSGDSTSELTNVLKFIDMEITTREKCLQLSARCSNEKSGPSREGIISVKRSSASALPTVEKLNNQRCVFCDSDQHSLEKCAAPMTVQERKEKLKHENRCFRCAKQFHRSKDCRSARTLSCTKCGGRHLTVLCDPEWAGIKQLSTVPENPSQFIGISRAGSGCSKQVLLQTAKVRAKGQIEETFRVLIDGGSQRSFIKKTTSEKLRCRSVGEEDLTIFGFGDSTVGTKRRCRRVEIRLISLHSTSEITIEALEVPEICGEILCLTDDDLIQKLQSKGMILADIPLENSLSEPGVSILIGSDYYWSITTGNVKHVNSSLAAVETIFGWCLQGPIKVSNASSVCTATAALKINVSETSNDITSELRKFWELESLGIKDSPTKEQQQDPCSELLNAFNSSITKIDGRYETRLLWKCPDPPLQNNKDVAETRLAALLRKLRRDDCLLMQYDKAVREYLLNGFAELVESDDDNEHPGVTYYLPHRAVIKNDRRTTKVRIVFDASSHAPCCTSLNENLYVGPNLNPELTRLLLNFRRHPIALCADIEKAFLQVSLAPEDRDALRFFWFRDIPTNAQPNNPPETWRMARVPFGASCSPFLLSATIRHHLDSVKDRFPVTTKILSSCLYVDDLLTGVETIEQAKVLHEEANTIMSEAGMNLHKWCTNEKRLQRAFDESELSEQTSVSPESRGETIKILGLLWNKNTDNLAINIANVLEFVNLTKLTKRNILQTSARIFDPLGLIAPVVVRVKLLFQQLWQHAIAWDDDLPESISRDWVHWCSQLSFLHELTIPRLYSNLKEEDDNTVVELHVFSDASPKAYGAVAYLRSKNGSNVSISLIMSKSRVAPLKILTLPRLELMGALLAARLQRFLIDNLEVHIRAVFLWTDSNIALYWIKGSVTRWKPFVANRVAEIQHLTDPLQWRHCPGSENPADLLTRDFTPPSLVSVTGWWTGPNWLEKSSNEWPTHSIDHEKTDQSIWSVEKKQPKVCITLMIGEPLITLEHHSNLNRLLRETAWVLRFLHNCKQLSKRRGCLTAAEINNAETTLVRQTQREVYSQELTSLKKRSMIDQSSPLSSLSPILDLNGIIRVGGRLQKTQRTMEEKHPIILPNGHKFTELLIRSTHERLLHAGVRDTLTCLREKYWILRARQATKKILKRCITCDRLRCKPASEPTAPLPSVRVNEADPFEISGMDFAGPLFYKDDGKVNKSYILVVTCAVTRAVHLELVSDLTTQTFILAFRRFISRRGVCRVIMTDNAMTFHRANRELTELWNHIRSEEVTAMFASLRIEWRFIVEKAAWWGGFWERMVRCVKTSLKKVLGHSYLKFEELSTILTEIEAVLNSRPLTFVYSEASEPSPLTPAHFLIGKRLTALPRIEHPSVASSNSVDIQRRWRNRQKITDNFWRRWRREYLNELRSAHHSRPISSRSLKDGDFVLVHEHLLPRQCWKMGRITETFPGRDGKVRSCSIRLPYGKFINRPTSLLYPLESLNE